MKKILKRKVAILCIILILFSGMPVTYVSFAETEYTAAEAGQTLANFAINFANKYGDKVTYTTNGWNDLKNGCRARAYLGVDKVEDRTLYGLCWLGKLCYSLCFGLREK